MSAFLVTGASEGSEGVRRLLRRIVLWRVKLRWCAFVLLGIPAVVLLSAAVMPGALASFDAAAVPSALVKFVGLGFIYLFIGGPVFEEIGWRGFAAAALVVLVLTGGRLGYRRDICPGLVALGRPPSPAGR